MGASPSSNVSPSRSAESHSRTLSPSSSSSYDFERNVVAGGRRATVSSKFRRLLPFPPKLLTSSSHHHNHHRFSALVPKKRGKRFSASSSIVNNSSSSGAGGVIGAGGSKRARSRNRDHSRIFRELILNWQLRDLHCLVVEFEASLALRELTSRADDARSSSPSVREDLNRLYQNGIAADLILLYEGVEFPVHKSFLSKRCSYFRRLFRQNPPDRRRIVVSFVDYKTRLNLEAFVLLLEYLYTGEICDESRQTFAASAFDLLLRFREEIEVVRRLDDDLASMYKNPDSTDADVVLIFSNSNRISAELNETLLENNSQNLSTEQQRNCRFKCHTSILSARSSFFRHLIEKRRNDNNNSKSSSRSGCSGGGVSSPTPSTSASPTSTTIKRHKSSSASHENFLEIVLDESVIPRQYAPVLINALYTDQIDMSLIIRGCVASTSCLTEVQAIASGKCQISPIDEATEIYQIARFLEFAKLAQGCEDVIVGHISLDSLPAVYNWSMECYGSAYVRRHCVNFLCQEFVRVACTTLLFDLEESLLVDTLKSDFVQASELEILNAVVRWGEHQLVRRLEEREPNILVGTTHSISRKGVRRSDLSDDELREVLTNLLPLVRTDYILPVGHPILLNAQSRGLINVVRPQQNDLTADTGHNHHASSCCEPSSSKSAVDHQQQNDNGQWTHTHYQESVSRPRLFLPYYETARALMEKQLSENPEQLTSLINHHPPVMIPNRVPDALYMVNFLTGDGSLSASSSKSDLTSSTADITIPDVETLDAMKQRVEQILRTSSTVKRGLACGCTYHRRMVVKQVRLRVVREFGLNDCALAVLENSSKFYKYLFAERPSSQLDRPIDYCGVGSGSLRANVSKRRFRSEPGLAQCDLMSSVSIEWPDLMTSSSNGERDYVSWSAEASSRLSVLDTTTTSDNLNSSTSTTNINLSLETTTNETSVDPSSSSCNAYRFVDLAAQINEFVEERERIEDEQRDDESLPRNLLPLDLTLNASEQRYVNDDADDANV